MKENFVMSYYRTVMEFSKKYELKNQGVLELALEENKELFEKVSNLDIDLYKFSEKEVVYLVTRYNQLKTKFDNYIKLVEEFSAMLQGAAEATAQTEKKLASEAERL